MVEDKSTEVNLDFLDEEEKPVQELNMDFLEEEKRPEVNLDFLDEEDSDRKIEETFGTDVGNVREVFPESIVEFFGRPSTTEVSLVWEDEDLPLDNTEENLPRLGVDQSVQTSTQELLTRYSGKIEALNRISKAEPSTANKSVQTLANIIASANVGFLTAMQQSLLLRLVSGMSDKKAIVDAFLEQHPLKPASRYKLSSAVDKIMIRYSEYLTNEEISRNLNGGASAGAFNSAMRSVENDLKEMQNYVVNGNVVYVSHVSRKSTGISFTCGSCGSENESQKDFVSIVVHESLADRESYIQVFPRGCVCDSCGKMNLLTSEEHRRISTKFNTAYNSMVATWASKSRAKLTRSYNIISYVPDKAKLPELYPVLYDEYQELEDRPKADTDRGISVMDSWYEELKSVLSLLDKPSVASQGGLDFKDGTLKLKEHDMYRNLEASARLYCEMFSEDFDQLRESSVNTLLLYIKENSTFMSSLSEDIPTGYELLFVYENYLGVDFGDNTSYVLEEVCKATDVLYEDITDGNGNIVPQKREELENKVRQSLAKDKEVYEQLKFKQKSALDSLNELLPFFSMLEINGVAKSNIENLDGVICLPEVKLWLERASLLMVVNKVSERALDYWKTLRIPDYKNISLFNLKTQKSFNELMDKMITKYNEYYDGSPDFKGNLFPVRSMMLSRNILPQSYLPTLYSLRSSVENHDTYMFYESVVALQGLLSYEAEPLNLIRKLIKIHLPDAKEFMAGRPMTDNLVDYYMYNFGDMFTEKEITDSLPYVREKFKKFYRIPKNEGEDFNSYITRLRESKFDSKVSEGHGNSELFVELRSFVPSIYAIFEFMRVMSQIKENPQHIVFMNEIIRYSNAMGTKLMFEFLGLPQPWKELYENKELTVLKSSKDIQEVKLDFMMSRVIFPDPELNLLASGATDEARDIFDVIDSDPERVINQLGYLGELGGLFRDHYFS